MKRITSTLLAIFFTVIALAVIPQKFNYQAVIRDGSGNLLANTLLGVRVSILNENNNIVYQELQSPKTNQNGFISINIGTGTVQLGTMAGILWSTGYYKLLIEIDISGTGGSSYSLTSESQILSVPYAMYATKAENYDEKDPIFAISEAKKIMDAGSGQVITVAERNKLKNIEEFANAYVHPLTHPASIIVQDASNRFVTDADIANWNAKQASISYTPEDVLNKKNIINNSTTEYPNSKAVADALILKEDAANKKTSVTNNDTDYPTGKAVTTELSKKEDAVNKKTVINSSDTEYPTSKAVKDVLDTKETITNKKTSVTNNDTDYPTGKAVTTELAKKEDVANKKTSVTNSDTEYPTGKAVTTSLALKEDVANKKIVINSSDTEYPSSKAVKDALDLKENVANKKTSVTNSDSDYPTGKAVTTSLGFKEDIANKKSVINNSDTEYPSSKAVTDALKNKVDIETGKGLSTNDYTNDDKTKLGGIQLGAEVNVNADWNATTGDAQILNKPSLSAVATSGSYNDLTNKPVIPTITPIEIIGDHINVLGGGSEFIIQGTRKEIGESYGGGIVFYVNEDKMHGLIACPTDLTISQWASASTVVNTFRAGVGAGMSNTERIIDKTGNTGAAYVAATCNVGGNGDWYLPSKEELLLLYNAKRNNGSFVALTSGLNYWSSTEYNSTLAYYLNSSGSLVTTSKGGQYYVRAIRRF